MYIALHLGRYHDINTCYRFNCDPDRYEEAVAYERGRENVLTLIRGRLMPDMAMFPLRSANRGIYQGLVDDRARDADDILQVIRHADAWFRHPEGGSGLGFFEPSFSGRYDPPTCMADEDKTEETLAVTLCKEQYQVLWEAAIVYDCILNGRMREAMEFYTADPEVLEWASELETMMPSTITKELLHRVESYTKWQRSYFDAMAPGEFQEKSLEYAQAHPYTGNAEKL